MEVCDRQQTCSQTFCEFSDMIACPSACTALTGTEALLSLCASWLTSRTNKHEKTPVRSAFFLHSILYHYPQLQLSRILNYFYCFVMFCTNKFLQICIYSYIFIDIYGLIQYAFCRTHIFLILSTCYFSTFFWKEVKTFSMWHQGALQTKP